MSSRRTIGTRALSSIATAIVLGSLLAMPATASDGDDAPYMAQFIDDHFRIEHRAELEREAEDAS